MNKLLSRLDPEDYLALAGLFILAVGLWMFRPWVSLAVVGVLLIAASLLRAR